MPRETAAPTPPAAKCHRAASCGREDTYRAGLRRATRNTSSPSASTSALAWLPPALMALDLTDDYERGVSWAVALGGDVDTNAAVAGALLGFRDGADAPPRRWLAPLRGRQRIERRRRWDRAYRRCNGTEDRR